MVQLLAACLPWMEDGGGTFFQVLNKVCVLAVGGGHLKATATAYSTNMLLVNTSKGHSSLGGT